MRFAIHYSASSRARDIVAVSSWQVLRVALERRPVQEIADIVSVDRVRNESTRVQRTERARTILRAILARRRRVESREPLTYLVTYRTGSGDVVNEAVDAISMNQVRRWFSMNRQGNELRRILPPDRLQPDDIDGIRHVRADLSDQTVQDRPERFRVHLPRGSEVQFALNIRQGVPEILSVVDRSREHRIRLPALLVDNMIVHNEGGIVVRVADATQGTFVVSRLPHEEQFLRRNTSGSWNDGRETPWFELRPSDDLAEAELCRVARAAYIEAGRPPVVPTRPRNDAELRREFAAGIPCWPTYNTEIRVWSWRTVTDGGERTRPADRTPIRGEREVVLLVANGQAASRVRAREIIQENRRQWERQLRRMSPQNGQRPPLVMPPPIAVPEDTPVSRPSWTIPPNGRGGGWLNRPAEEPLRVEEIAMRRVAIAFYLAQGARGSVAPVPEPSDDLRTIMALGGCVAPLFDHVNRRWVWRVITNRLVRGAVRVLVNHASRALELSQALQVAQGHLRIEDGPNDSGRPGPDLLPTERSWILNHPEVPPSEDHSEPEGGWRAHHLNRIELLEDAQRLRRHPGVTIEEVPFEEVADGSLLQRAIDDAASHARPIPGEPLPLAEAMERIQRVAEAAFNVAASEHPNVSGPRRPEQHSAVVEHVRRGGVALPQYAASEDSWRWALLPRNERDVRWSALRQVMLYGTSIPVAIQQASDRLGEEASIMSTRTPMELISVGAVEESGNEFDRHNQQNLLRLAEAIARARGDLGPLTGSLQAIDEASRAIDNIAHRVSRLERKAELNNLKNQGEEMKFVTVSVSCSLCGNIADRRIEIPGEMSFVHAVQDAANQLDDQGSRFYGFRIKTNAPIPGGPRGARGERVAGTVSRSERPSQTEGPFFGYVAKGMCDPCYEVVADRMGKALGVAWTREFNAIVSERCVRVDCEDAAHSHDKRPVRQVQVED